MSPRFLQSCEVFQPAEKACWRILLDEQDHGAAIPPAELDAAIDRTLSQLWALLRSHSVKAWLKEAPALSPRISAAPDCAIQSLLAFFGSGRRALELIAPEVELAHPQMSQAEKSQARTDLQLAFRILVQRELQALCGPCSRQAECRFRDRVKQFTAARAPKKRRGKARASA